MEEQHPTPETIHQITLLFVASSSSTRPQGECACRWGSRLDFVRTFIQILARLTTTAFKPRQYLWLTPKSLGEPLAQPSSTPFLAPSILICRTHLPREPIPPRFMCTLAFAARCLAFYCQPSDQRILALKPQAPPARGSGLIGRSQFAHFVQEIAQSCFRGYLLFPARRALKFVRTTVIFGCFCNGTHSHVFAKLIK